MATKLFDIEAPSFTAQRNSVTVSAVPHWVTCPADEFIRRWLPRFDHKELPPCTDEEWRRIMALLYQSVETQPVQARKLVESIKPVEVAPVKIIATPIDKSKPIEKAVKVKRGWSRELIEEFLKRNGPSTAKVIADKTNAKPKMIIGVLTRNPNIFEVVKRRDSDRDASTDVVWGAIAESSKSKWRPKEKIDRIAYLKKRNVTDCEKILEIIKTQGKCTSRQVAAALKIDHPKAGNRLRILHEKGLIEVIGTDRRCPVFAAVENPSEKPLVRGAKGVPLRDQITDYLKSHTEGSTAEIATAIGRDASSVRTITARMYHAGELDATECAHPKFYRVFRLKDKEST